MLKKVKTMEEVFYTPQEVATKLKVAYMTVYRWIKVGKLKSHRAGKQYRISDIDLKLFFQGKQGANVEK